MKRRLRYAEVQWDDAHGGDEGWTPDADMREHHAGRRVVSVGQVLYSNKKGVTLIMSRIDDSESSGAYIFIPRSGIVSQRTLVILEEDA